MTDRERADVLDLWAIRFFVLTAWCLLGTFFWKPAAVLVIAFGLSGTLLTVASNLAWDW